MLGLKQRHTYDQLINIVKSGGEIKKDKKLNVDLEVRVYLESYIEILEQHILKLYDVEKLASKVYKEK